MKKSFAFLLLFCLVFAFSSCTSGTAQTPSVSDTSQSTSQESEGDDMPYYTLKVASHTPNTAPLWREMVKYTEIVEERTDGHIKFELFPDSALGDYVDVYTEVMRGTIDMSYSCEPTNYDPRMNIITIPGLVTSYEQIKEEFKPGKYYYDLMSTIHSDSGVKLLAMPSEGFGLVGLTCKENPGNYLDFTPSSKPLIRIPSTGYYGKCVEALGYRTNAIAFSDVYTALQTGVVDGLTGLQMINCYESYRDILTYIIDYSYMETNFCLIINQDLFNGMPEEYQTILEEEGIALTDRGTDANEAIDIEAMEYFAENGAEYIGFTDEEKAIILSRMQEEVIPEIATVAGKDVVQGVLDAMNIDFKIE